MLTNFFFFLPTSCPLFSFSQPSSSRLCHIASWKTSKAKCWCRCLHIVAAQVNQTTVWLLPAFGCKPTDTLLQTLPPPHHVLVQSLLISNLIPHFVCSFQIFIIFSICILNASVSASEAHLIVYFSPAHPSLLMVVFAAPPTLSVVSL